MSLFAYSPSHRAPAVLKIIPSEGDRRAEDLWEDSRSFSSVASVDEEMHEYSMVQVGP